MNDSEGPDWFFNFLRKRWTEMTWKTRMGLVTDVRLLLLTHHANIMMASMPCWISIAWIDKCPRIQPNSICGFFFFNKLSIGPKSVKTDSLSAWYTICTQGYLWKRECMSGYSALPGGLWEPLFPGVLSGNYSWGHGTQVTSYPRIFPVKEKSCFCCWWLG